MKSNMTIPSRPAPAPPTQNSSTRFSAQPSRYTPTTNWDDSPFGGTNDHQMQQPAVKKPPPPRPPPPKLTSSASLSALKKPVQSVNILSNLFGSSKSKQAAAAAQRGNRLHSLVQPKVPPKLPAPPATNHHHHNRYQSTASCVPQSAPIQTDVQLISFDSPPDSPTLTQKSNPNSDCVSIDSFSSDSNYSSPHNESACASQAESGFEDDFGIQQQPSRSSSAGFKQWEVIDPFSQPPSHPIKAPKPPPVIPKSKSVGGSSFFSSFDSGRSSAASRHQNDEFLDPLCNGKTLVKAEVATRPTIIKPKVLTAKPTTTKQTASSANYAILSETFALDNLDDSSLLAIPMPNIPPPPPPAEYFQSLEISTDLAGNDEETNSYGLALYDFSSDQMDDLNFKVNEKIYLVRQINEEWLFGRNRRGCEGMFPANYVDVKIPIKTTSSATSQNTTSTLSAKTIIPNVKTTYSPASSSHSNQSQARVLYDFNAETVDDLTIRENEMVTVLYRINAEWLYGQNASNMYGQFPANFIDCVPSNLSQMP